MRTSFVRPLVIAAMATLALAACGSSSKNSAATTGTTVPPGTTAPEATTTTAGSTGEATVSLAKVTKIGEKVLVDSKGMTLYVWDNDKTPGKSSCTGQCEQAWPLLYVTGSPTYGAGVDESQFTTITSDDGDKQLAVNGKPLYTWVNDKKAGDATGQDVNGFYVVGADGKKIDES